MKSVFLAGCMKNGKDTVAEHISKTKGHVVVGLADALKRHTATLFGLDDSCFWGSSDERNRPFEKPIPLDEIEYAAWCLENHRFGPDMELLFDYRISRKAMSQRLIEALRDAAPITSARVLLQRMGTEFGRALWEDVWVHEVDRVRQHVEKGVVYLRRDGLLTHLKTRLPPASIVVPDVRYRNEARYAFETLKCPVYWVDASRRVPRDERFAHTSEPTRNDLEPYVTDSIDNNRSIDDLQENIELALYRTGKS